MKLLVPASATLSTFMGALVKNIQDLGVEHAAFLCLQDQPNLFLSVPKQLKSMYDLMQEAHSKILTGSCSVIAKGRHEANKRFMLLAWTINAAGEKGAPHCHHCISRSRQCTMT